MGLVERSASLEIELDRDDPVYTPDDTVTGRVLVDVDMDVECEGLELERVWKAHGEGNEKERAETVETLFSGQWRAGQKLEYPFEVSLPPGPYTYRGELLNVDWLLRAEADIGLLDAEAEEGLELEPSGSEAYVGGDGRADDFRRKRSSDDATVSWDWTIAALLVIAAGVYLPISYTLDGREISGLAQLGMLAWHGVGLWLLYRGVRNHFAEKRIGDVDVEVSAFELSPGDELECRLEIPEEAEGRLNGVEFELRSYEKVVAGSGKNSSEKTHELHSESVVPDDSMGLELEPGRPGEVAATFRIPGSAGYTFRTYKNRLIWSVTVRVDVPLWPDWIHEESLFVRPAPAERTDGVEDAEASTA